MLFIYSIYPFTAIHLDCLGSNVDDYMDSLRKILKFASEKGHVSSTQSTSSSSIALSPSEKSVR
jgi:hypothetical protein